MVQQGFDFNACVSSGKSQAVSNAYTFWSLVFIVAIIDKLSGINIDQN